MQCDVRRLRDCGLGVEQGVLAGVSPVRVHDAVPDACVAGPPQLRVRDGDADPCVREARDHHEAGAAAAQHRPGLQLPLGPVCAREKHVRRLGPRRARDRRRPGPRRARDRLHRVDARGLRQHAVRGVRAESVEALRRRVHEDGVLVAFGGGVRGAPVVQHRGGPVPGGRPLPVLLHAGLPLPPHLQPSLGRGPQHVPVPDGVQQPDGFAAGARVAVEERHGRVRRPVQDDRGRGVGREGGLEQRRVDRVVGVQGRDVGPQQHQNGAEHEVGLAARQCLRQVRRVHVLEVVPEGPVAAAVRQPADERVRAVGVLPPGLGPDAGRHGGDGAVGGSCAGHVEPVEPRLPGGGPAGGFRRHQGSPGSKESHGPRALVPPELVLVVIALERVLHVVGKPLEEGHPSVAPVRMRPGERERKAAR